MGDYIHGGGHLEIPSESERRPPLPVLPSFALESPPVLPIGKTQQKTADLEVCGGQRPANSLD